jgi:hypothetical protein
MGVECNFLIIKIIRERKTKKRTIEMRERKTKRTLKMRERKTKKRTLEMRETKRRTR